MKHFKQTVFFSLITVLFFGVGLSGKLFAQNGNGGFLDQGTSIDAPAYEDGSLDKTTIKGEDADGGVINGTPHADYDWGDDDPGGPGGGGNPPIDDVPFDGGVGLLLALGIVGGYKVSKRK